MGLKCSVLGHRFEEPGLVDECEQRGNEVINIKRKVMVCTICGEQRILAERKEITNNTCRDDVDSTDDGDGSVTVESDAFVDPDADVSEGDEAAAVSGLAGVDVVDDDTTDARETEPDTPHTDDAVILSDVESGSAQERLEWPDESSWHPAAEEDRPGTVQPSDTIDAVADDGEILASSPESSGGELSVPATGGRADSSVIMDDALSCSSCGFSVLASDSPFRPGDSCPRCHEAYLAETGTASDGVPPGGRSAE